jgi:hypothetical protein
MADRIVLTGTFSTIRHRPLAASIDAGLARRNRPHALSMAHP